ncbi:exo-alpha-sialidase [Shewanella waksmanii]|uniref:exo-alpha-sialidase n=1 Tax=Shewanella waksmanii TaxID=213783 RepID=UPI003735AF1F
MQLIHSNMIWDCAPHNAFTDLVRFNGALYCIFREGEAHVCAHGALRLLKSVDEGQTWQSVYQFTVKGRDLRDGKLVVFNGLLLAFGAGPVREPQRAPLQSFVWKSADGSTWSKPKPIAEQGEWLWRIAKYQDRLYGVAYFPNEDDGYVALYQSEDGDNYRAIIERFNQQGYVNESGLSFISTSVSDQLQTQAYCLLRRDPVWSDEQLALLGVASAPFTDWRWVELDKRVGGPVTFVYQDKLYAVVRLYDEQVRTAIVHIDIERHIVNELIRLPSAGDTSYAGVVVEGDELLVSYYSSHEVKTAIYFAKVALS